MKKLRRARRITQEELAAVLSVSKFTVSSYENEHTEPDDSTKVLIAKTLDVSLDYLLGLSDVPNPPAYNARLIRLPQGLTETEQQLVLEFFTYLEKHRPASSHPDD
jgi:transcriptional regulator with XRE-family HTH domain